MSINDFSLSLIIPVFNEVDNIATLYQEINTALGNSYQFEIIFVDDGSTDGSLQCLMPLAENDRRVKVIAHDKNYGQSAAILSGARTAQYPWLLTLDGDGQNDPQDIHKLIAEAQSSSHIVIGTRIKRDDSWIRKISSKVGKAALKVIFNDKCADAGCSLKLFPKQAFLSLPHFNHLHRFMAVLFNHAGYKIVNVTVNHRPRLYGKSKYGISNRLWVGIIDLFGVCWLLRRTCSPELKS